MHLNACKSVTYLANVNFRATKGWKGHDVTIPYDSIYTFNIF